MAILVVLVKVVFVIIIVVMIIDALLSRYHQNIQVLKAEEKKRMKLFGERKFFVSRGEGEWK